MAAAAFYNIKMQILECPRQSVGGVKEDESSTDFGPNKRILHEDRIPLPRGRLIVALARLDSLVHVYIRLRVLRNGLVVRVRVVVGVVVVALDCFRRLRTQQK